MDDDVGAPREIDRLGIEHLGTGRRDRLHGLVAKRGQQPRLRADIRIRAVDPIDIGIDLARLGRERRGQRHRRGV